MVGGWDPSHPEKDGNSLMVSLDTMNDKEIKNSKGNVLKALLKEKCFSQTREIPK